MKSKRIFLLITIFILPLLPNSCKKSPPQTHKDYGDTLIIGAFQKPTIINPILTSGSISASLLDIIFDGLVKIDKNGEIKPNLAESWEISENGLEWIFHLRKGVKFHDGVELTAEDVKFTYNKFKNFTRESIIFMDVFNLINEIKIIDKYTIKISLIRPMASFLYGLLYAWIIPKHLLEKEDLEKSRFSYHPVGTGPFKLSSFSEKEIVLEANDKYFSGKPYLDDIIVKIFENQKIAWVKLMSGEVDFIYLLDPGKYDITKKASSIEFYTYLRPYYHFIGFNHENELFKDKRVRRALNYAVDKDEIIEKVLKGQGRPCAGTVYPLSRAYNPEIKPYTYNPEKALNLLKEAGWEDTNGDHILDKDGKNFIFFLYLNKGDDMLMQCALLIQQFLLDIGVKIRVKAIPVSILVRDYLNKRNFESDLIYIISTIDHDNNYIFWHSSQIQEGKNVFSYTNREVDRLLEEGRATLNQEKRKEIYYQLQKEMFEDPPGIFLFWREALSGINRRFRGVKVDPEGLLRHVHEWWVPKEEQKY